MPEAERCYKCHLAIDQNDHYVYIDRLNEIKLCVDCGRKVGERGTCCGFTLLRVNEQQIKEAI